MKILERLSLEFRARRKLGELENEARGWALLPYGQITRRFTSAIQVLGGEGDVYIELVNRTAQELVDQTYLKDQPLAERMMEMVRVRNERRKRARLTEAFYRLWL